MELEDLGFDHWFEERREKMQGLDCSVARITRVDRGRYTVRNQKDEIEAEATGKLLFSAGASHELPCVGDWVDVQYYNDDTLAIIHQVLPRKSFLRRKSPGKTIDYQMIASNIDTAFILQSCDADFNIRRLERYLVMTGEGNVESVILLSKSDLVGADDLAGMIADIGRAHIREHIIPFSSRTGEGTETIRQALRKGKTYCLLGSSGVGKTTLLNHLLGQELFETQPVRESDGRGRHVTTRRQLTILDNGALLIDTPGLRELGMIGVGSSINDSFSDIAELSAGCRFRDCTHAVESGCAILGAVGDGRVSEERYQSYMKLTKESEFHRLSYVERRQKEKKFGRMVKAAMKRVVKK